MAESEEAVVWDEEEWEPAERAVYEWATGVLAGSGVDVVWRDRVRDRRVQVPYLELSFGAEVAVGWDELAVSERVLANDTGEGPGGLKYTISGAREVMLSMVVRTRDQRTFGQARRYLGKLRQSLQHPAYVEVLERGGLGLVDCEPIREIPSRDTSRMESLSILEVKFSTEQVFENEEADNLVHVAELVEVGVSLDGEPVELVEVDLTEPEEQPEAP